MQRSLALHILILLFFLGVLTSPASAYREYFTPEQTAQLEKIQTVLVETIALIGLHCRLAGRPGCFAALERFVDYVQSHKDVWVCKRVDIARHWRQVHPFKEFV